MSLIPVIELLQHGKEAVKIPSGTARINLLSLNKRSCSICKVVLSFLSVCKADICDIQDMIKSGRMYPNLMLAKIKKLHQVNLVVRGKQLLPQSFLTEQSFSICWFLLGTGLLWVFCLFGFFLFYFGTKQA